MTHFIVVYASREGQTQKVAHHVASQIEALGHTARLINVGDDEPDALLGEFDAAVLAGNLDSAERASALGEFVKAHKAALAGVPSALLSVTLAAGAADRASRTAAQADLETFEDYCGWRPSRALAVGGAVHDRSHGVLKRALLHVWMHLKGIKPDPSGHTELTDWDALDAFVREFVGEAAGTSAKPATRRSSRGKSARAAKSASPKPRARKSKKPD